MRSSPVKTAPAARRLVLVVPGIGGREARWKGLLDRLRKEPAFQDTQVHFVDLRLGIATRRSAQEISTQVLAALREKWTLCGRPAETWLFGASVGGLVIRRAYLDALRDPQMKELADSVRRIVLFAGINRGINVVDPVGRGSLVLRFTGWLYRVVPLMRAFLVNDILRGSSFVTNLRIEWIRQFAHPDFHRPTVIQFLPGNDWLVKRDDSRDVEQFADAVEVDVADATHGNVYRPEKAADPEGRYTYLKDIILTGGTGTPASPLRSSSGVCVFLVHGIRANNREWVAQAQRLIAERDSSVVTVPFQYGYLSAFGFAIPAIRRKYVRLLMDEYSQRLADDPSLEFRFLGHSNGTYLLGESLLQAPGMRFTRVVLVGSVLPRQYDWRTVFDRDQVTGVDNHRSNRDWPVAHLCSALRGLGMRDVGTAGYEGFDFQDGRLAERYFHEGDHSAPLSEKTLPDVMDPILAAAPHPGKMPPLTPVEYAGYRRAPAYMPRAAQVATLVLVVGLATLAITSQRPTAVLLGALATFAVIFLVLDTY